MGNTWAALDLLYIFKALDVAIVWVTNEIFADIVTTRRYLR
jgi:hypothetical protein